jgi:hypothetical protein
MEKHFPAPDRDKINRILGIGKQKTILDELGIKLPDKNGSSKDGAAGSSEVNGRKRPGRKAAENVRKKMKQGWEVLESDTEEEDDEDKASKNGGSDFESKESEADNDKGDSDSEVNSEDMNDSDEDDFNPFGSGSEDDDPWSKRSKKKKQKTKKSNKVGMAYKND